VWEVAVIKRLRLAMPLGVSHVNCYLVQTGAGFVLVDTGGPNARSALSHALVSAGCLPGGLALIVLTHGDSDHCGNARYLRQAFETRIALHPADFGMVERGDMSFNRRRARLLFRFIALLGLGLPRSDCFTPDLALDDGLDLAPLGIAARVIHTPGHSAGSVSLLTAEDDLLCGDLLANHRSPRLNRLMDDPAAGMASAERLQQLDVRMVYPGHGDPFSLARLGTDGADV
jgi:glyoxylase-like metal-dependent hydrolase (beta-lactamase superfamily II)